MTRYSRHVALLACGGLILAATAAVAGSGVGGVFNLGQTNTVNARTHLTGSTTSQQLYVLNNSTSARSIGVLGASKAGSGVEGRSPRIGVRAAATGKTGVNYGVYSTTASPNGLAGFFQNTSTTTNAQLGRGIRSLAAGASQTLFNPTDGAAGGEFAGPNGVIGVASHPAGAGVVGRTASVHGFAGYFQNSNTAAAASGVRGLAGDATGSEIDAGFGGGGGEFIGNYGVIGAASFGQGYGVLALEGDGFGALRVVGAALIQGDLQVTGTITKGVNKFKIDHPQDPANKYLSHSVVESPDMKNVYDGNVVTDAEGLAVVELPGYFEALNRDPRYQLTVIGSPATAYVAQKVSGNRFAIKTSEPGVEVSWQVTGIRQDAFAKAHPIVVEEEKKLAERGRYLNPEVHGMPAELGIHLSPGGGQRAAQHDGSSGADEFAQLD